jgi:hypothetical protein
VGGPALCVGSTEIFSDASSGTWSSVYPAIATIDAVSGLVTSIATGIDSIKFTTTNSCGTATTFEVISINPLPTPIVGIMNICEGSTTTLVNSGSGTWQSGSTANAIVGSSSGIVTGVIMGSSVITFRLYSGCMITAVVTIDPMPLPIQGDTIVCIGDSIVLSDATIGGTWTINDITIATSGAVPGVIRGVSAGSPIVSYTSPNGCLVTKVITVTTCVTGIRSLTNVSKLVLYPNPANTAITLASSDRIYHVLINNLLGQTVYCREYNSDQVQINVANLSSGVYFVKINGIDVKKFVKE